MCRQFLNALLSEKCPGDIKNRLWSSQIEDALKQRYKAASDELGRLVQDTKGHPINYDHYFTKIIKGLRKKRLELSLEQSLEEANTSAHLPGCHSTHTSASVDVEKAVESIMSWTDPNMENVSCEEALDGAYAIYKVVSI